MLHFFEEQVGFKIKSLCDPKQQKKIVAFKWLDPFKFHLTFKRKLPTKLGRDLLNERMTSTLTCLVLGFVII